jgi:hypothetical protein
VSLPTPAERGRPALRRTISLPWLVLVIGMGWEHLAALPERAGELSPADQPAWQLVFATAILCFYAFLGFEDMVNIAEEVRNPRTVLPPGIILTLLPTALLYGLASEGSLPQPLANLSLVLVKLRTPSPPGARIFPLWVPVLGCVVSFGFVGLELTRWAAGG